MNIIDSMGVVNIFANNIRVQGEYYLAPDVEDEVELAKMTHGRKTLPSNLKRISVANEFDEAIYLKHYKRILNQYSGKSFYNMKGFGDVSILSILLMLVEVNSGRRQMPLIPEKITVFTDDGGLTSNINKEFKNGEIEVKPSKDIL